MNIKEFIEDNVPAEVIAGAYKKCFTPRLNRTGQYASHTFLKHYLQKHWTGPAAIAAVEKATGKPNSITVQYRYDRKGRHPINEGVIGTRSLSYFCRDWFAPYLFDHYTPPKPEPKPEPEPKRINLDANIFWCFEGKTREACLSKLRDALREIVESNDIDQFLDQLSLKYSDEPSLGLADLIALNIDE